MTLFKNDFVVAYTWLFGATKKEASKVWKESNDSYKKEVILCFKDNAKRCFYED